MTHGDRLLDLLHRLLATTQVTQGHTMVREEGEREGGKEEGRDGRERKGGRGKKEGFLHMIHLSSISSLPPHTHPPHTTQGKVLLPLPSISVLAEAASSADHRATVVHVLESSVVAWMKQIKVIYLTPPTHKLLVENVTQ